MVYWMSVLYMYGMIWSGTGFVDGWSVGFGLDVRGTMRIRMSGNKKSGLVMRTLMSHGFSNICTLC